MIIDDSDDHCASNDEAIPIHGRQRYGCGDREKDEYVDEEEEDNRADINGQAVSAQAPSAWREGRTANSAEDDAGDGDYIGGQ